MVDNINLKCLLNSDIIYIHFKPKSLSNLTRLPIIWHLKTSNTVLGILCGHSSDFFLENSEKLFVLLAHPNGALVSQKTCICCQVVSQENQVVKGCRHGKARNNLSGAKQGWLASATGRPQIWGQIFVFTWHGKWDTSLTVAWNVIPHEVRRVCIWSEFWMLWVEQMLWMTKSLSLSQETHYFITPINLAFSFLIPWGYFY